MENVKEQDLHELICKCGAHVRGDVPYCPHCGGLLVEANIRVVSKDNYDALKDEKKRLEDNLLSLRNRGYAPKGSRIIKDEDYNQLQKRVLNAEEEKNRALRERNNALNNLRIAQLPKTETKNNNNGRIYKIIVYILLTIGLFFGGIYAYQYFDAKNNTEFKNFPATNEVLNNLVGNYTLREYNNGEIVGNSKTAVLRKENSCYIVTIVTDFGPEYHSFTTTSNNLLSSETLGDGEVTYKEAINKITIRFKKNNYLWEFVK
jgi:hypothetical protein